jgi:hypothetical protein
MEEDDTDGDSDTDKSDELDEEDNEEDVPIPCSWNHDFSLVNDGHDYSCEYHQNNGAEEEKIWGERFLNKRHLHEAIIKQ